MPDPASPARQCRTCWWWSSDPGERTGYCYEHDQISTRATHCCDEWDDKKPASLKFKKP